MSYASDFELKAGDKVEVTNNFIFHKDMVKVGDVATYKGDYTFSCPTWGDTQVCSKDFWSKYLKPYVAAKPKTPFEEAGYTKDTKFKVLESQWGFSTGEIVSLDRDDASTCPKFISDSGNTAFLFFNTTDTHDTDLEVYMEESAKTQSPLTFPCAVLMSEIKDQDTFDKIFALFIASGADKYETDYEDADNYKYFGVDYDKDTVFYGCVESYSFNDEEDEVTAYSVAELLGLVPEEETTTVPVIALLPIGAEVQIAKDSEYYDYGTSVNPKDVKGKVINNSRAPDHVYRVMWDNGVSNVYKLEDLVLWNEGWIEWNGSSEAPVEKGTKVDIKYHDGSVAIGIGSQDGSSVEGCSYICSSWYRGPTSPFRASVVAYRLHVPSVASQEAITERLEDNPSVSIDLSKDASSEPLVSIIKDVTYTVTIKGTPIALTQDELNELSIELDGFEDYE